MGKNFSSVKRMLSQDIAKGLAIMLVIAVHTYQVSKPVGAVFAIFFGYLLTYFFFMSGYNYKNKGLTYLQNIKKRTVQILLPLLIYSLAVFVVMGAYFLIRGEATIPELLKSYFVFAISKWGAKLIGWNMPQVLFQRLLGPCWFLQYLVMANFIFYAVVDWAIVNGKRLISCVVGLCSISTLLLAFNIILPWGIQDAPAIAALMIVAAYCKKENLLFAEPSKKYWTIINCIVCVAAIAIIELLFNGAGFIGAGELGTTTALGAGETYVMIIIGVIGTYFIVNVSKLIEKIPVVSKFLIWIGQHTFLILILHLSFVHIIKDILNLPQTNSAEQLFVEHPIHMNAVALLIAYIVIPLFLLLHDKVLFAIINRKKKKA